jgi:hypothetical protein
MIASSNVSVLLAKNTSQFPDKEYRQYVKERPIRSTKKDMQDEEY